jgi:hypothetical protein
MHPHYVSIPSSFPNSSPWQVIDNVRDPVSLTVAIQSSGANWQVDVAVDDPTGVFPNPTLNSSVSHQPGQSFAANVTIYPSTAFAGGGVTPGAGNAVGVITADFSHPGDDIVEHGGWSDYDDMAPEWTAIVPIPLPPALYDHPPAIAVIEHVLPSDQVNATCHANHALGPDGRPPPPGYRFAGCAHIAVGKCVVWRTEDPTVRRHELAHCNGWPVDHPNAKESASHCCRACASTDRACASSICASGDRTA